MGSLLGQGRPETPIGSSLLNPLPALFFFFSSFQESAVHQTWSINNQNKTDLNVSVLYTCFIFQTFFLSFHTYRAHSFSTIIPWNGATMGLPPPFLIVRIRPAILLTSHRSAKIRAARIIQRVGQIIDPLAIWKLTTRTQWIMPTLDHVNFIILLI